MLSVGDRRNVSRFSLSDGDSITASSSAPIKYTSYGSIQYLSVPEAKTCGTDIGRSIFHIQIPKSSATLNARM